MFPKEFPPIFPKNKIVLEVILVLKKTLHVSGEKKGKCNNDMDCEHHEQCSDGNCFSACALLSCRRNANCIAENHKVKCKCREGYRRDGTTNKCERGRRIQCSNFCLCTGIYVLYIFRNVITNQKKIEKTRNIDFLISLKRKNAILEMTLKSFIISISLTIRCQKVENGSLHTLLKLLPNLIG